MDSDLLNAVTSAARRQDLHVAAAATYDMDGLCISSEGRQQLSALTGASLAELVRAATHINKRLSEEEDANASSSAPPPPPPAVEICLETDRRTMYACLNPSTSLVGIVVKQATSAAAAAAAE
eukprot:PhM_4_TR12304/c0_g1_i2/m.58154